MKTLYIERSTGECRSGNWVEKLDLDPKPDRLVVGTGPGSFAGIRSAIAFAQGYRIGSGCEVLGLPSPCAVIGALGAPGEVTVVGDARQGKIWLAAFEGWTLLGGVRQVEATDLFAAVSPTAAVVTPDEPRLGARLSELFGLRYRGGQMPTAEGLRAFAEHAPELLKPEPLPLYLSPAVRS